MSSSEYKNGFLEEITNLAGQYSDCDDPSKRITILKNLTYHLHEYANLPKERNCSNKVVKIKKAEDCIPILPKKSTLGSAGFDLYGIEHKHLATGQRCLVRTGLSFSIPKGYYGRIAPRSGLAVKYGIDVLAGVIDSDYRGEVKIVLINHGDEDFNIKPGDRVAQLIIEKYASHVLIKEEDNLESTHRGEGGFGSTGN